MCACIPFLERGSWRLILNRCRRVFIQEETISIAGGSSTGVLSCKLVWVSAQGMCRACDAIHSQLHYYLLVLLSQIMQLGFLVLLSVIS